MSKIYVDEIQPKTSGGWPVMPDRPAWRLTGIHQDITSTGAYLAKWQGQDDAVSADNRRFVLGGCTLNGATTHITVPQTGLYQVNTCVRIDEVASSFMMVRLRVNDSLTNDSLAIVGNNISTDYDSLSLSDVLYLRVNDTVSIDVYSNADTSWEIDQGSNFSGVYLG